MPAKKRTLGYISLQFDGPTTNDLKEAIIKSGALNKLDQYKTVKDEKHPAHVTLAFHTDPGFSAAFVDMNYKQHENKSFPVHIDGFVHDEHCVALVVNSGKDKFDLPYLPPDKKLHVTMMLNNKPPVYSNELLSRDPIMVPFAAPIIVQSRLQFNYIYI